MATVTKPFNGCKDGERQVTEFAVGDTVEGELAKVAISEGWATDKKPRKTAPKNKASAAAPKNK